MVEKPGFKRNFIENFESNKSKKTTETEKFQCDKCGNLYLFRESLRKHLIRHLNPANCGKTGKVAREKIVCDRCSKLVDPSSMKRHFQVHHSKKRPFKCTEPGCTTSFFDISKFNDHKNIHLEIKPYVCEFCSKHFEISVKVCLKAF